MVEIQGKADEVQFLVVPNSTQTSRIVQVKDTGGNNVLVVQGNGTTLINILSISTEFIMPTSQPTTTTAGSTYFDVSTATLYIYDGTVWKSTTLT